MFDVNSLDPPVVGVEAVAAVLLLVVRVPVAPAVTAGLDDVSIATVRVPAFAAISPSSVFPPGGTIDAFVVSAFTVTTRRFPPVVVTDGAM